jgi:hypothetical protein
MANNIIIKPITTKDIPTWVALSHEYDCYVKELVPNLIHWYEGSEIDISFESYMKAKISKNEAFMVYDNNRNICLGAIAFSTKFNRITFFGISHTGHYNEIGETLLDYALGKLNSDIDITITVIRSKAPHIQYERGLLKSYGFVNIGNETENGVPVDKFMRQSSLI